MNQWIGAPNESGRSAENLKTSFPCEHCRRDEQHAALIALAPDGIFVSDAAGRYIEVNEAGCQLFQCPREALLGRTFFEFLSPEQEASLRELVRGLQKEGIHRFEWLLRRPDNSEVPIEVHTRILPDGKRQSIVRDISEQKAREHELRLTAEAMQRLNAISALFLQRARDEEVFAAILDAAVAISSADYGSVQVFDTSTGELRLVVQQGLPSHWEDFWRSVPPGKGACGTALAQGARVIVEDVEQSPLFAGTAALEVQRRAGVRAVQSTPLLGRAAEPLGVISTHYKTPRRPSEIALRLLDLLARHVADLLQHRRIGVQLRRTEAKATGILAASADAIISTDPSGRIKEWNHSAEQMFGYSRTEALGMTLDTLLPAAHRTAHREHVARFAADSGRGRRMDHRSTVGQRKSGEVFPIDAVISSVQIEDERILTVAVRDVTEQRRVENEQRLLAQVGGVLSLLGSPDSLRQVPALVVDLLADYAVLFTWGGEGEPLVRIAAASREPERAWAAEYMMAAPPQFAPGYPVWQAISEQRPVFAELDPSRYEALAQSPEHLHALHAAAPRSTLIVPLCAGGKCLGALALSSSARSFDPQAQRLAEEVARRCALFVENERLHRAEKQALRVRDEVLGIVAHDLRNPLNAIGLQLQLLLRRRTDPADRWKDPAERIHAALQRMNRLIQDLLDVTRLESGALSITLAALAPDQIICEALESQRMQASAASIELRSEVVPGLPNIQADRGRIQQTFENLLGNAIKFTEPGGTITVGAVALEREILFRVSDTGRGIPAEHLSRLFDRFWQAERTDRRGVGLGLSIVKGIVTAHGGRLWAESTVGRGTTFFFTLPITAAIKR